MAENNTSVPLSPDPGLKLRIYIVPVHNTVRIICDLSDDTFSSARHSTIEICRLVRMGEEREFRIAADAMLAERMALRRCEQYRDAGNCDVGTGPILFVPL